MQAAYDTFDELGATERQFSAAYNLGLTLAHSEDPGNAAKACQCLKECLPWLMETQRAK